MCTFYGVCTYIGGSLFIEGTGLQSVLFKRSDLESVCIGGLYIQGRYDLGSVILRGSDLGVL